MKTVHKLILKSYLGPMFLTFFIVMFVLLMQFMWRYIDELVGKGLDVHVILELMFYASATLIPMGLPLATLLAAIMTMGNLGENNELLALKSAGISLPRIIRPLAIVIFFISIASFFVANNLVPYSTKKIFALIYDIRQQRQTIEFKDGIFFNGIDNMSIRVANQDPRTHKLEEVLIYDTPKTNGDMTTTVADSGYISLSDDKKFLLVTLYNGETYEETRSGDWYEKSGLRHHIFDLQDWVIPLEGFDMTRTDESMFNSNKTKNIGELTQDIDSLQNLVDDAVRELNNQFLSNSLFVNNKEMAVDTLPKTDRKPLDMSDSIAGLNEARRAEVVKNALNMATGAKSYLNFDEETTKQNVNNLYKYQIEWHRMLSLPVSIMIFFLIGAPLGAIIRKGGLGTPIVVSVAFFIVYYIITIFGQKMAGEGTWSAFAGMWLSTFILFPIAAFLTYKATNDSSLLNGDWYRHLFRSVKEKVQKFVRVHKKRA